MRGGKYPISGQLGHYGRLRQGYVEQFCPETYRLLCVKNRVQEHYAYVDQAAFLVYWRLFEDFSERIGLTADLHARDPEEWARRWNHCHHRRTRSSRRRLLPRPLCTLPITGNRSCFCTTEGGNVMQEEVEQRTLALVMNGTKLTGADAQSSPHQVPGLRQGTQAGEPGHR